MLQSFLIIIHEIAPLSPTSHWTCLDKAKATLMDEWNSDMHSLIYFDTPSSLCVLFPCSFSFFIYSISDIIWCTFQQFIKIIHFQLKYGLQKESEDTSSAAAGVSALLDDSWFSSDSFLHHLCKVPYHAELVCVSVSLHIKDHNLIISKQMFDVYQLCINFRFFPVQFAIVFLESMQKKKQRE